MKDKDNVTEHNKSRHPSDSAGMTKGASVGSGLSSHSQIKTSHNDMGMAVGAGQRPKAAPMHTYTHGGKSFKTK